MSRYSRSSLKNREKKHSLINTKGSSAFLTIIGALALIAAIAFFTLPSASPSASRTAFPPEISVQQAYSYYTSGVFFLDVRTPQEWEEGHIPNSTLIPLDELPKRLNELPASQPIVVVCRSGNRSQQGREILRRAGFEQVTSMSGGINQWRGAGYPVTSGP